MSTKIHILLMSMVDGHLGAILESGRLLMPWESGDLERRADDAFDSALRQAQQHLYKFHDPEGAAARLRAAALKARQPVERARAELLLAASLSTKGDRGGSRETARRMLRAKPAVIDEYGVPYALYAAQRLLGDASREDGGRSRISFHGSLRRHGFRLRLHTRRRNCWLCFRQARGPKSGNQPLLCTQSPQRVPILKMARAGIGLDLTCYLEMLLLLRFLCPRLGLM